jgi:hypothetical protein
MSTENCVPGAIAWVGAETLTAAAPPADAAPGNAMYTATAAAIAAEAAAHFVRIELLFNATFLPSWTESRRPPVPSISGTTGQPSC